MKRKTFGITISVLAAVVIALAGLNIGLDRRVTWDSCYEMANAKISWEQTFHSGPWSE